MNELILYIIAERNKSTMTNAEMLQFQMIDLFFARLQNLTDRELMIRKSIEMELGHNLKNVNSEINRRIKNA